MALTYESNIPFLPMEAFTMEEKYQCPHCQMTIGVPYFGRDMEGKLVDPFISSVECHDCAYPYELAFNTIEHTSSKRLKCR